MLSVAKKAGAAAGHIEHLAKSFAHDKIAAAISHLPAPAQSVVHATYGPLAHVGKAGLTTAFAAFTATQRLAGEIAKERGLSEEESRRLRGVLSKIDLGTFEVFKAGALVGIHASHLPAMVTGVIPVASASYIAYSTARNPIKTARAANRLIRESIKAAGSKAKELGSKAARLITHEEGGGLQRNRARLVADALQQHDFDDWYIAIFSAALDQLGDVHKAIAAANRVYNENPKDVSEDEIAENAWTDEAREKSLEVRRAAAKIKGELDKIKKSVVKHTGYKGEELKTGVMNNSVIRSKVVGSIFLGGNQIENAILYLKDRATKAADLIAKTKGDPEKVVKELGTVAAYDTAVLNGVKSHSGPVSGEAVCHMDTRVVDVGSTTRPGSYRHELGHAIRAMLGGSSFSNRTAITKAINAEYENSKKRLKADPPGKYGKQSQDFFEEKYGVISRRCMDNWEEYFAEHYRVYMRELYRDEHEGGGGAKLARYRKHNPGMAKIFDAYYTAALLGENS
jgi:hypothetical protein